jgi:phage gp45-like
MTTESGHVVEVDDTPGQERIHVYHKSGTYVEINKDGRMVTKIVGDDYEISAKNKEVFISGDMRVTINGNVDIKVNGTYTVTSGGSMRFNAPRIDFN